jgi:hypothetical protein
MCIFKALYFAPAVEELGRGQVTEISAALQYLFILGPEPPIQEVFEECEAARQLSGHLVTVQRCPKGKYCMAQYMHR